MVRLVMEEEFRGFGDAVAFIPALIACKDSVTLFILHLKPMHAGGL